MWLVIYKARIISAVKYEVVQGRLTMINSTGQGQGHTYFYCEYIENASKLLFAIRQRIFAAFTFQNYLSM